MSPHHRLVVVESPYRGDTVRNEAYARLALKDCIDRGEYPIASHLLYTQVLDDRDAAHRILGISAGLAWAAHADLAVFYYDLGISDGMFAAQAYYRDTGKPTELRHLFSPAVGRALRNGTMKLPEAVRVYE